VLQAPIFDGHLFDALSFDVDGFIPAEVSVCGCHVAEAFVVALMIIVVDERFDLSFEVSGEEVVFEQDAVFKGLVPALDFALGLRMIGRAAHMFHFSVFEPYGQIAGDVAGPVIRQQAGFMQDLGLITT